MYEEKAKLKLRALEILVTSVTQWSNNRIEMSVLKYLFLVLVTLYVFRNKKVK